jgi:hypothetical protein
MPGIYGLVIKLPKRIVEYGNRTILIKIIYSAKYGYIILDFEREGVSIFKRVLAVRSRKSTRKNCQSSFEFGLTSVDASQS